MEKSILQCALFRGMSESEVQQTLQKLTCVPKRYKKGEVLLHAGYENHNIGILVCGEIEAVKLAPSGGQFITAHMEAGSVFGDILAGSRTTKSPVTVVAASDVSALWVPFSALVGCGQEKLLQNYIALISDKYFSLDRRIEVLLRRGVREKLLYYLSFEALPIDGGGFQTPFSRSALANYLGCERSALCREIGRMRREGVLRTKGRTFFLQKI